MRLSVLDQSPVRSDGTAADAMAETIALAKACERLGYHRYWLAEHHNTKSFAGSAPEVLIARVAAETKTIRVGSGGVMLTHYSPLKVAEQFRMLEILSPGRIDLGLGRAPGTDQRTSQALQAGPQGWGIDAFPSQVHLLRQFLDDAAGTKPARRPSLSRHPRLAHGADAAGDVAAGLGHPQRRLCGRAGPSLRPRAFHQRRGKRRGRARTIAIASSPRAWCERPRLAMGVAALAAETEEEARRLSASRNLWVVRLLTGRPIAFPPPEEALDYPYTDQEKALLENIEARSTVGTPDVGRRRS